MVKHKMLRKIVVPALVLVLLGLLGGSVRAAQYNDAVLEPLSNQIEIQPGQVDFQSGQMMESEIYGSIAGYSLKKGHTLSISDENYVFSVRQLIGGNYDTLLKAATADSFTASEDMTVACLIRKPDKSAVTAEELAGICLVDTLFDMEAVPGNVHRFTVEAETIDGGTHTTRAAIFLPDAYSETGTPTPLIIMTNGYHGHLTDSVWNANKPDDVALMKHYLEANYAVLVVDNTTQKTSTSPDWGNPQLVSSYFKAYEYVQAHLNVEEQFSLHSRSMGTFAAVRIMREHPELVKCAIMCGPVLSLESRFSTDPAYIAKQFGFDDTTGATYEADKVVGYDPYTDVNGGEYTLPPTFWMMAETDATSAHLNTIEKIKAHGNDVTSKLYTGTDHSGVCRLNIEECWNDALAYLQSHQTSDAEHRYCAWETVAEATCTENGEMRRICADCGHAQIRTLPATGVHQLREDSDTCVFCGAALTTTYCDTLTLSPGHFRDGDGAPVASSVYGCVIGYELKAGHTLSLSDEQYVFAVRQLVDGNYNTLLRAASADSFTAETDTVVAIRVRKPDSSALTQEELASLTLTDTVLTAVEPHTHTYSGTICTGCGQTHPNAADFEGKVISILSASTSTFAGYIPVADGFNLEHRARYPQDNLLTDVNETWWMQVITELDAKLGINDSWAGSQVLNTQDTNSGDLGPDAAMASLTRIQNLGANGTPDVIFFFGGGNDIGRGVTLGSFDPETAPTQADLTATKWDSFADAYVAAILRLQYFYPEAQIVVMTTYAMPSYATAAKLDKYGPVIRSICEHYGVSYVDLRESGVTFDMLPDNVHPNAEGMDHITAEVLQTVLQEIELEPGENAVYPVTHELTNAEASLHYYKGVSAGKPFTETVSGEDLTVTVVMGGRDITASVYQDGVIAIPAVTGELVITAKAAFSADGHLQQLPENVCAGTNLWTALEPENTYYTVNGWGNTTAGTSWSVTFPVEAGDRVWATSFGAYPGNGSTADGVRVTWFDENGVLETVSRDVVYAEFAANGYLTAPEGAVAVNVPMTNNQADYAVYLLSAEHVPGEAVKESETASGYDAVVYCDICGGELSREHVVVYTPGDINGDGKVNNKDATRLFQYLSGWNVTVVEAALDVNGDGKVNNKDATRLFQHLSGWNVEIY